MRRGPCCGADPAGPGARVQFASGRGEPPAGNLPRPSNEVRMWRRWRTGETALQVDDVRRYRLR